MFEKGANSFLVVLTPLQEKMGAQECKEEVTKMSIL